MLQCVETEQVDGMSRVDVAFLEGITVTRAMVQHLEMDFAPMNRKAIQPLKVRRHATLVSLLSQTELTAHQVVL